MGDVIYGNPTNTFFLRFDDQFNFLTDSLILPRKLLLIYFLPFFLYPPGSPGPKNEKKSNLAISSFLKRPIIGQTILFLANSFKKGLIWLIWSFKGQMATLLSSSNAQQTESDRFKPTPTETFIWDERKFIFFAAFIFWFDDLINNVMPYFNMTNNLENMVF